MCTLLLLLNYISEYYENQKVKHRYVFNSAYQRSTLNYIFNDLKLFPFMNKKILKFTKCTFINNIIQVYSKIKE